jgi:hypothetical protein
MNLDYEEELDKCWSTITTRGRPTKSEKRNAVLSRCDNSEWKCNRVFVSLFPEKRFTCVCSQALDRYFVLENKSGCLLRVGTECIEHLLPTEALESAYQLMKSEELRKSEQTRANKIGIKPRLL